MLAFIVVNGRTPMRGPFACAACGERLDGGYIHELTTDLKYCDCTCFKFSERMAQLAIENRARRTGL